MAKARPRRTVFGFLRVLLRSAVALAVLGVLLLAGASAYRLARAQVAADVYLERITELRSQYDALQALYNEAVRKTAVTELLVEQGRVSVVVRDATGATRTVPTPFSADRELYVDFAVLNGRLWIRRVFDDRTAPGDGVVIDPKLVEVDWDASVGIAAGNASHGKAVYRRLGEGRWVVTVTGDGALGLARADGDRPAELTPAPVLKDFATLERDAAAAADTIGVGEVVTHLFGSP